MARFRRVGKYATFTPPSFLDGVCQAVDVWGESSSVSPPRIVHLCVAKKAPTSGFYFSPNRTIRSYLSEDVRKIGQDISVSLVRYGKQLPSATAEAIWNSVKSGEKNTSGHTTDEQGS